jgi:RNA polymerase sigma-70 factor (ECF subfamily)
MQPPVVRRSARARLAELSDDELIVIARKQLPHVTLAYEVLVKRYQERLLRTCNRYLCSFHDAEEAVHETLLRVFHHLPKFKGESSFKTWLFRIAHNESMNILRKRKEHTSIDDLTEEPLADDSAADHVWMNRELERLLRQLGQEDRTVIVFRTVAELEFQEIADILQQNLSTVKMRYQRAIEKLRELNSAAM